jgi:hypothetical protein
MARICQSRRSGWIPGPRQRHLGYIFLRCKQRKLSSPQAVKKKRVDRLNRSTHLSTESGVGPGMRKLRTLAFTPSVVSI